MPLCEARHLSFPFILSSFEGWINGAYCSSTPPAMLLLCDIHRSMF